ncbi:DNA (cytosine-5-)-methyltransferase [Paraburkholderia bannensis]|nr:DNA (cytosine-5-)-methyltransferase [Paraburkholderia bannensis]RQM47136.1 DNA (cytosine-5-)-methyltransferase [Paraburkholderia bannensis]
MAAVNTSYQFQSPLRVVELFAGVGGFRLGLEQVHGNPFEIVLSNQWEPGKKVQHASAVYQAQWQGDVHLNEDVAEVLKSEAGRTALRKARPDVVVGGFPCQDYSVAKPLSQSQGIEGKKGVLWWSIAELLRQRIADGEPVKYLVLENVDRLISSPAVCRGRDFAMVLSTLYGMGYAVEWRVVNAADYGFPQRRRRVFIVAYHVTTGVAERAASGVREDGATWFKQPVLSRAFPATLVNELDASAPALTLRDEPFSEQLTYRPLSNGKSRFANSGIMIGGKVWTGAAKATVMDDFSDFTGSACPLTLGDVVRKTGPVPTAFYVREGDGPKWLAAKAAKRVPRVKNGFEYEYAEGAMAFPDPLDRPSRTIITSEGGSTASRTKHAVREASGLVRRLTPEELEELNGFPRGFTDCAGASDSTRAMLMGNALVVGLVTRIGEALVHAHTQSNKHTADQWDTTFVDRC